MEYKQRSNNIGDQMGRNHAYTPLLGADNDSERIAHYLKWTHQNRPGERISYREIAKVVFQIRSPTNKYIQLIKRRHQYIAKKLAGYDLGFDSNGDGIRPLDSAQEVAAIDYAPTVMEVESKRLKSSRKIELVERLGGVESFDNTPEGRHIAQFYTKTSTQINRLKLPPRSEMRNLLVSHNPTDE
jgi:hypothetical protein